MRSRIITAIIVCFFCLAITSCMGSNPPDGYLATSTNSAYFIQFTAQNNQLNGHIQGIAETNDVPPQTKSSSTSFTGTQNGSSITLTVSIFGFSSSVAGTLNGNTLTLEVPQADGHLIIETFTGASLQQYNQAVDDLQKKLKQVDQQYYNDQATVTTQNDNAQSTAVAVQATQTAEQQEQQAVEDANSTVSDALSTLKSDDATLSAFSNDSTMTSYANDWQTMQNDYAMEQKDALAGCGDSNYNHGTVQYDAGTVDYDKGTIQYDDGTLNYDKNTYMSDLSAVQNDVRTIKDAWMHLQQAAASNTTKTPAPGYTSANINTALQAAQNAEDTAGHTWQSAQSQATQYDQEASALQKKADALPASMNCS
jgi:hypothetical protein